MSVFPFDVKKRSRFLVAGAGGGFDFLCGLPICLELERRGHDVTIASYSFAPLGKVEGGRWHGDHLVEIDAASSMPGGGYFPEVRLSKWYEGRGIDKRIWCLTREGVQPTLRSYDYLIGKFGIDTVICVDGGVDGIFRGDEHDLGTPSMDSASVIAASLCRVRTRIYACTAFGTEGAEGKVSHAQVLNRMADLIRGDAMLGVGTILRRQPSGGLFAEGARYVLDAMPDVNQSTIVNSVLAAMDGAFGRTAVNAKTRERMPWISPLTAMIWYFDAGAVARMKLFYDEAVRSETVEEVASAIDRARTRTGVKDYEDIPI